MKQSLIKVWAIRNLYLLNHREENNFKDKTTDKGRNVKVQWEHLHNTRLNWDKVILTFKLILINTYNQSSKVILKALERQKQGRNLPKFCFNSCLIKFHNK